MTKAISEINNKDGEYNPEPESGDPIWIWLADILIRERGDIHNAIID